jgi:hypothetical protein
VGKVSLCVLVCVSVSVCVLGEVHGVCVSDEGEGEGDR